MQPDWRILIDGQDRSDAFRDRLLSLTVTDESGYHSDTVSVRLDDRDGRIVLPRPGVEMVVQLGYEETGRAEMGRYTVDEIEVSGPPDTLVVRGKSADMFASLKQHKSRSWSGTLGDIVGEIAEEHDLEARVGSRFASVQIPHIDQTEESDLHFLTRLGQQYDAVAKPAGRYLFMVARGEAATATGRSTTSRTVHRSQTSRHRISMPNRERYQSVIAYFHNSQSGRRSRIRAGSGPPSCTLRNPYPTAAAARAAAAARLKELTRGLATIRLTVQPGNPLIAAESCLQLTGFRSGIDGAWIVTGATHKLVNGGYSTRVQAELPSTRAS